MARVLLITHGSKGPGADPGLTSKGRSEIERLVPHLPLPDKRRVFCGTARRHIDTAEALDIFQEIEWYDPMLGDPSSGVPNGNGGWNIALACNAQTTLDRFRMPSREATLMHLRETYGMLILAEGSPDVVLVAGRPVLESLKLEAASSAVYELHLGDGTATRLA